jgi:two-component system, response regulator FlrC
MPRLLVVDDDPLARSMIHTMLSQHGYEVVEVKTGAQALRQLLTDTAMPFDAVLTDLMMPEVNGVALTAAVRQRFPYLPILIISAYGHWAADALERGANDYLQKPFHLHDLLTSVKRFTASPLQ